MNDDTLVKIGHNTYKCTKCDTIYDESGVDPEDCIPAVGDSCDSCTASDEELEQ